MLKGGIIAILSRAGKPLQGLETRLVELAPHPHIFHRDSGGISQRPQQHDFGVLNLVWHGPVVPDGSDRIERANRDDAHTLDERRPIRVMRYPRIRINIGNDNGLAVLHRPATDALFDEKPFAFPERRYRILVRVVTEVSVA